MPVIKKGEKQMTGTLITKKMRSGKKFLYVQLSYKNPQTGKWDKKQVPTGLEERGNKKKAAAMIPEIMEQYAYLSPNENILLRQINPEYLFIDYLDDWLTQKSYEIKKITYEGYVCYSNHIKEYFLPYNLKVREITSWHIDQYLKYQLKCGKINQKTKAKEPLAVRSVRSHKSILSAVFDQACIDGLIKTNPVAPVKVHGKQNKDYSEEEIFLTEEELTDLLLFLSENYPRLMPIAFVGAYYGLRRSELLGLKWDAVDFEKRIFTIRNTVVRSKTIVEAEETKTKDSYRSLFIFDNAEKCFNHLKNEQDEYRRFFGDCYKNTSGYVFTHEDGSCYTPDYISKQFTKAMVAFGRPEITFHKLRHTCASMAIERGWNIKQIQYWLGHRDIQTTLNIYAHYNKKKLNSTNEDMNFASKNSAKLFAS